MMKLILFFTIFVIIFAVSTSIVYADSKIPEWVKNVFVWYGQNQISEDELLNSIKFLIENKILTIDLSSLDQVAEPRMGDVISLPYTWKDKQSQSTFLGLFQVDEREYFYVEDKFLWHFKIEYRNLLKESVFDCLGPSLYEIKVETDNGNIWKYSDAGYPISYCTTIDPLEIIIDDSRGIFINKSESPKYIHLIANDQKYTFEAKILER